MGLAYLVFFAVYLLVSVAVVRGAIGYARKSGRSAKRWGWGAAFIMYSLVFWDWIPTVAVHQFYCAKDSGFWVYKTLDQWKAENPGVMGGLVENKNVSVSRQGDMDSFTDTYLLNQRINKIVQFYPVFSWLTVHRHEQTVVDSKTKEVLARYVNFGSSDRQNGNLKFWMRFERCRDDGSHPQHQFYEFEDHVTGRQQ